MALTRAATKLRVTNSSSHSYSEKGSRKLKDGKLGMEEIYLSPECRVEGGKDRRKEE